jgi:DNA-binding transcriptional ArsR family regulator
MQLNVPKRKILELLWREAKPLTPKEISRRVRGVGFPATMMHLLGLKKMGYVESPERGLYKITELGEKALGFKQLTKESIKALLTPTTAEKSFHFYAGTSNYLKTYATDLKDFCQKILEVDIRSVEFHTLRRDFENWFRGLGDLELAKKMEFVREKGIADEELRKEIYETVRKRCEELEGLLMKLT